MPDADFTPLRPRRHVVAGTAWTSGQMEPVGELMPACVPTSPAAICDEDPPSPSNDDTTIQDVSESVTAAERSETPPGATGDSDDAAEDSYDDEERAAALREEAIRFASIATARALRTTLAQDAAALTCYVDDALRACGRVVRARVRLHPVDAALYRPRSDVEIIADASSARGEVTVETDTGTLGATIEERAALLARAAGHA
jgi:hypothetical protein